VIRSQFKEWLVGFSRDFVFGLIAFVSGQDCRCNWDRSSRDPKMKAREHAGAAIQTMTDEHIEKTKSAIESAENIPADRKAELLDLLSKLKPAIAKVSETHHEDAKSIARLVEASAHETIRPEKKPEHTHTLLHELKKSVEDFEASHPELAASVGKYSTLLSALGI
jgi:Domain of unknown function (DUF4404)